MSGRPEILFPLFAEAQSLPGVGPRTAGLIEKVAGPRVKDLLAVAPTSLVDRTLSPSIAAMPAGQIATVMARVDTHDAPPRHSKAPYKVILSDATGFLTLAFFRGDAKWLEKLLPVGEERIVSGLVNDAYGARQIVHPDHVLRPDEAGDLPPLEPIYPLTAGLTAKTMAKAVRAAVAAAPNLPEWLDTSVLERDGWPAWQTAIQRLHQPTTIADIAPQSAPRRRLAYDELLAMQLALGLARTRRKAEPGRALSGDGDLVEKLLEALPFSPTRDQSHAFAEIAADMARPDCMVRLLQGDVGAGKTLVAALAMCRAAEAGAQSAMMAPTEVLARQHAAGLKPLLERAGLHCEVLTGRDKGKRRQEVLAGLADGSIHVVVGTHALFQDDVAYADLGLVVIDEQHRFGVEDRERLQLKGDRPDVLLMTATPIPRTLTLAAYGDIDVSILREKPPGRSPVDTRAISIERLDAIVESVERVIERGECVYWVCPLVEESEFIDWTSAEERFESLKARLPKQVGLVHGQMKPADKDAALEAFRSGKTPVLVATTVVEVGVDVPEATLIVIEHAERFGLAQLHQLRGRVGRSERRSACVLAYKGPLNDVAKRRLEALRQTNDGFLIAEEDLKLRGAGDLLGVRQAGLPELNYADLEHHGDLLAMAADDARLVAARDPHLESERGKALRILLHLFEREDAMRRLRGG